MCAIFIYKKIGTHTHIYIYIYICICIHAPVWKCAVTFTIRLSDFKRLVLASADTWHYFLATMALAFAWHAENIEPYRPDSTGQHGGQESE